MVSFKTLPAFLGLFALASAQLQQQNESTIIEYNVINLLNDTHYMAVSVDNVTYPLSPRENFTVLHSGLAPAASSGYQYVKVTKENNNTEAEPFLRNATQINTPNEFFNRTWNTKQLAQLPTAFEPLPVIQRISSQLHREGEIPTIHLTGNQTLIDLMHGSNSTEDYDVPTSMTYISLNDTLSYQNVTISLAGRSSRWMPKLSYNIKLAKKDRLYDYRRMKLRALDTDPSYIREQIAYDIIKKTGLLSSEFSYVRLFLNDRELGLFGIIDTFQDPWLANVFANGASKYKNGNLYQGVFQTATSAALNHTSDLAYYDGNITAYQDGQYKIKVEASKGKKNDYEPLMEFTKFVAEAPTNTSDAVSQWQKVLDTDGYLRAMALEVLLGYSDGYFTMADNYYLYNNLEKNNFFYIPSDMDLTMGSAMFSLSDMWSGNYSTFPGLETRPLMNKILQVPEFKQQYEQLLVNITQSLTNPVAVNDRINDVVDMIREDVAWDQTLPRVADNLMAQMGSQVQDNSSNVDAAAASIVGDTLPANLNMTVIGDFAKRLNVSIPLDTAVNGNTGYLSLSGVKEWFQVVSQNVLNFYNVTPSYQQ